MIKMKVTKCKKRKVFLTEKQIRVYKVYKTFWSGKTECDYQIINTCLKYFKNYEINIADIVNYNEPYYYKYVKIIRDGTDDEIQGWALTHTHNEYISELGRVCLAKFLILESDAEVEVKLE